MRAARLITLLLLLQSRGRMSGRELAEALEVSIRTVYRDVEALNGGGVPIYAERGATGGFHLMGGYRLQLETLTAAEAAALPWLSLPDVAGALGVESARASAGLKMQRALPEPHRTIADETASLVHLDLSPGLDEAGALPWLRAIVAAAQSRRAVTLRTAEGSMDFAPLGVVYRKGWYAVGLAEGTTRAIPAAAIEGVAGTPRRFERPPFDLGEWWRTQALA